MKSGQIQGQMRKGKKKIDEIHQWVKEGTGDILEIKEKIANEIDKKLNGQFIVPLFKEIKNKIREDISNFRYKKAKELIIRSLLIVDQIQLSLQLRCELEVFEGEIALKLDDFKIAKEITTKIIETGCSSEEIAEFLCFYASIVSDDVLFNEQISALQRYTASGVKFNLRLSKFLYFQKKYDEVITNLCENSLSHNLKKEYTGEETAAFYAGLAFFVIKNYSFAIELLKQSTKPDQFRAHEFYLIKAKAFDLIDKKFAVLLLSEAEKNSLQILLDELNSPLALAFIKSIEIREIEEYWILKIQIALYISEKKAHDEYEMVPKNIRYTTNFISLYIDILMMQGKFSVANELLIERYKSKPTADLVSKIFACYMAESKYQEILNFAKDIEVTHYNDENSSFLIEAFSNFHTLTETLEYLNFLIPQIANPTRTYAIVGNIHAKARLNNEAKEYYEKMLSSLSSEDNILRKVIAKEIYEFGHHDIILRCLVPCIATDEDAQKMFVYAALISKINEYLKMAESIIEKNLENEPNNSEWLKFQAQLLINQGKNNAAKETFSKLYHISQTMESAYNLAKIKLQVKDYSELDTLATKLVHSNDPIVVMLGALCYHTARNYSKAELFSLYSIALLGEKFNEQLAQQYLLVNLLSTSGSEERAELEEVVSDCTIHLVSDSNEIWIGTTSNKDILCGKNKYSFIGVCFHYCQNSEILQLLGLKINQSTTYKGISYRIKEIWAIKTKIIRHFLTLIPRFEKQGFMEAVPITVENITETMKPILVQQEFKEKEHFQDYNFRNKVGLPLNSLIGISGSTFPDVIVNIWQKPNQAYYAGEINNVPIKERVLVLSLSSISLLHTLGLLGEAHKMVGDNLIIVDSVKQYFANILQDTQSNEKRVAMTLSTSNGHLFKTDVTENMKEKRAQYYRTLFSILDSIHTESIGLKGIDYDDNLNIIKAISVQEYESIILAERLNALYLSDDLFVRKFIKSNYKSRESVTSISIINILLERDFSHVQALVTLSDVGYITCYDFVSLCMIYKKISVTSRIVGPGSNYDILLVIVKNSLLYEVDYDKKIPIIINFINYLYNHYNDIYSNYVIEVLTKYLYMLTNLGKLNQDPFIKEIERICGSDPEKLKYFRKILSDSANAKIL